MIRPERLTTKLPPAPRLHLVPKVHLAWWVLLFVGLIAFTVYANSLRNDFALDDNGIIAHNPTVNELQWHAVWHASYWPAMGAPPVDRLYRPLTIYTYLMNWSLTPGEPWSFHLVNVFLHAACSILVCVLSWRLVRSIPMMLFAGTLFAIHPIHTEAVANVVGRAELLAAFWSLVTLLIFLPRDIISGPLDDRRHWTHGILVAVCFLLAIASKETPATLLLAIPLLDQFRYWHSDPLARPARWARWTLHRSLQYYLPLGAVFALYLAARINAVGFMTDTQMVNPAVNSLYTANLLERAVTPFLLLAKYILLFAWPKVLMADYSAPSIIPTTNILAPLPLLGLVMVVSGLWMIFCWWRNRPALVFCLIMFIFAYGLIGNVLRIGTIFGERLFYWPSVFACLFLGYAVASLWKRTSWSQNLAGRLALGTCTLLIVCLACYRTIQRNPDWLDNRTMAISAARDNPHSGKALSWAGNILLATQNPAWHPVAETLLLRSIELYPAYAPPYLDLVQYYEQHGREPESLIMLARVALEDGGHPDVRRTILIFREKLRHLPLNKILPVAQQWQKSHPDDPSIYLGLGWCYRALNRPNDAEQAIRQALMHKAEFDEAGAELGLVLLENGDAANAVPLLRHYALRAHTSAEARCQVAFALLKLDHNQYPHAWEEAENALASALRLDPQGHGAKIRELQQELQKRKNNLRAEMHLQGKMGNPS